MLFVLLACVAPDPIHVPGTETATPTDVPPDPTGLPAVDLVGDALEGRCPGMTADPGPAGDDLHRVTLADAGPVCNDGTPPVLYVRAATDPVHAADWVVYVDGGSFCSDHETCAVRWCGEDRTYDAGKMSTAWARDAIGADGMRSRDAFNAFAGWNHAVVYYCSSDFWTGTKGDHVFEGDPPYRVRFEGHDILMAALDALQAGVASDDAVEALPPLTDAATVLFTGSSAGGYAAGQKLNEVVARLPDARVIGVVDSFVPPALEGMTAAERAQREASLEGLWDSLIVPVYAGVVDPACLAVTPEPWRCSDLDVVLRTATTAELVVHQDLFDPVLYPTYDDLGWTAVRTAELWSAGLRLYADTRPDTSTHGSRCPHHTALSSTAWFSRLTVDDDAGTPWSLHDVLAARVAGIEVSAIDEPDGARTTCP